MFRATEPAEARAREDDALDPISVAMGIRSLFSRKSWNRVYYVLLAVAAYFWLAALNAGADERGSLVGTAAFATVLALAFRRLLRKWFGKIDAALEPLRGPKTDLNRDGLQVEHGGLLMTFAFATAHAPADAADRVEAHLRQRGLLVAREDWADGRRYFRTVGHHHQMDAFVFPSGEGSVIEGDTNAHDAATNATLVDGLFGQFLDAGMSPKSRQYLDARMAEVRGSVAASLDSLGLARDIPAIIPRNSPHPVGVRLVAMTTSGITTLSRQRGAVWSRGDIHFDDVRSVELLGATDEGNVRLLARCQPATAIPQPELEFEASAAGALLAHLERHGISPEGEPGLLAAATERSVAHQLQSADPPEAAGAPSGGCLETLAGLVILVGLCVFLVSAVTPLSYGAIGLAVLAVGFVLATVTGKKPTGAP